ncbi:MAG: putative quinol monooxygenase [Arenicellales bacterium]
MTVRKHQNRVLVIAFVLTLSLVTISLTACGSRSPSSVASPEVAFLVILDVPATNQAAFDTLANRMVEASRADDGMLIYEFSRVGEKVYGYERYTDDDAHQRHQVLIEPFMPELLKLAKFDTLVTLTAVSDMIRPALESIGATIGAPIAGVVQGKLGE